MSETEKNFGERSGAIARNTGIIAFLGAVAVEFPPLIVPALGLAVGGEVLRRVSKQN